MELSKYIGKALEIIMEKETEDCINRLEGSTHKAQLAYIYGYEKGCIEKDLEQEDTMEVLNRIDTKVLITTFSNLNYLIEFLKKDNDILVKSKVVQEILNLNEYINEVATNGND